MFIQRLVDLNNDRYSTVPHSPSNSLNSYCIAKPPEASKVNFQFPQHGNNSFNAFHVVADSRSKIQIPLHFFRSRAPVITFIKRKYYFM